MAIFIHIPKCAGTAIYTNFPKVKRSQHTTAWVLKTKTFKTIWDKSFTFTFVRNPWHRLVSWYFYHQQKNKWDNLYKKLSFEEWVLKKCPHHWKEKRHLNFFGKISPNPLIQKNFLRNPKGKIIVDFVGKVENFNEDLAYIVKKIGVQPEKEVHKINCSKHLKYTEYYSNKMRDIVYDLCKEDIESFSYKYGE